MKDLLGYVAMLTGTLAAIMVSVNAGRRLTGYGFVIFTLSSLTWIAYAMQDGETPLILQNAVLTAINLGGIYRWLIARK
jgi:type IV secretory pathway TrbD component